MKTLLKLTTATLLTISPTFAAEPDQGNPQISYQGFALAVTKTEPYRAKRRIDLDTFLKYSKEENTIILDTRSERAYDLLHIKGAIHLNFSDFTKEALAKTIPNKNTRILIYCNNNFFGEKEAFPSKRISTALNIPTFINLLEYGYKNVYELKTSHPVDSKKITFAGTKSNPPKPQILLHHPKILKQK